jgi:hypothetical protein
MIKQLGPGLRLFSIALIWIAITSTSWGAAPYSFSAFLAEGYGALANAAQKTGDKERISFFRDRAALADSGQTVYPAETEKDFSADHPLREAAFAREQLIKVLENGARRTQPRLAATAQVNFDCWVAALRRHSLETDECRNRFYVAFVGLETRFPFIAQSEAAPIEHPSRTAAESLDPGAVQLAYASGLQPEIPKPSTLKAAPPSAAKSTNTNPQPDGMATKRVSQTSLSIPDESMWRRFMTAIEKLW